MITHVADAEDFARAVERADAGEEAVLEIEGDAYRHLFRSRRLPVGARLRVVDGRGRARAARVASVERRRAEAVLGESVEANESELRVTLLAGALRPERADTLVEKATEIGVHAVRFLRMERTPRRYGEGRLDRMHRVARAAVEQCGRAWIPPVSHHEWDELEDLLADGPLFVLRPGGEGRLRAREEKDAASVVIGPEGGFAEAELLRLGELGAVGVDLGPRILRVETAAMVAAAGLLLPF